MCEGIQERDSESEVVCITLEGEREFLKIKETLRGAC